jgi:hypothetical protein
MREIQTIALREIDMRLTGLNCASARVDYLSKAGTSNVKITKSLREFVPIRGEAARSF